MSTTTSRRASATQLAQIVAVASGVKTRTEQALTKAYHQIQKPQPFAGIARSYRPRNDDDELLPPESTQVQVRTGELIEDVASAMVRMLDVVATQEWANTQAKADLVIGGTALLSDVPVTYLMWLEKQIVQLRTFINRLPVLDVAEEWSYDDDAKAWATTPTETTRTKKIPRNHQVAPATDRHPAQVQVYHEDVVVGYWKTVRFSGAIPASAVFLMNERVEVLLDAVRFARERANTIEVTDVSAGAILMEYVFRPRP